MAAAANGKAPSKGEILTNVAEETGLSRKQVSSVLDSLGNQIAKSISKKGPGLFVFPGLMKITIKNKPATKQRKGIDPFTKEERIFKAKPASRQVKIKALKNLKEMAK